MKNKDLFFVGLSEEISQGVNRREGDSRGLAGWETGWVGDWLGGRLGV